MLIQQGPLLSILYDSYTLIFCKFDFAILCIAGYGKLPQLVFLGEFSPRSIRKLLETFDVDRSLLFIITTTIIINRYKFNTKHECLSFFSNFESFYELHEYESGVKNILKLWT